MGNITVQLYDETPRHRDNFVKLVREGFYDSLLFHRVIKGFMIQGGDPDSRNAKPGKRLGEGGPGYKIPAEIRDTLYHKRGALAAARKGDQMNPKKESSGSQFYLVQGKVFSEQELRQMNNSKLQQAYNTQITRYLRSPENDSLLKVYQQYSQSGQQDKARELWNSLRNNEQIAAEAEESASVLTEKQIKLYTTAGGAPHLDGGYTVFGEVVEGLEVIDRIAEAETDSRNRPKEDVVMKMRILD